MTDLTGAAGDADCARRRRRADPAASKDSAGDGRASWSIATPSDRWSACGPNPQTASDACPGRPACVAAPNSDDRNTPACTGGDQHVPLRHAVERESSARDRWPSRGRAATSVPAIMTSASATMACCEPSKRPSRPTRAPAGGVCAIQHGRRQGDRHERRGDASSVDIERDSGRVAPNAIATRCHGRFDAVSA